MNMAKKQLIMEKSIELFAKQGFAGNFGFKKKQNSFFFL